MNNTKKFVVRFHHVGSKNLGPDAENVHLTVEAEDEEKAKDKAVWDFKDLQIWGKYTDDYEVEGVYEKD